MLQRLGGCDLHLRHGEATADAHALAGCKTKQQSLLSSKLAIGCAIKKPTTKGPEVGRVEIFGVLLQKSLRIEPLRFRIEVLAVVAGRRREEDLHALLHKQARDYLL